MIQFWATNALSFNGRTIGSGLVDIRSNRIGAAKYRRSSTDKSTGPRTLVSGGSNPLGGANILNEVEFSTSFFYTSKEKYDRVTR